MRGGGGGRSSGQPLTRRAQGHAGEALAASRERSGGLRGFTRARTRSAGREGGPRPARELISAQARLVASPTRARGAELLAGTQEPAAAL